MLIEKNIAQKVANVCAEKHREGLTDKQDLWGEIYLTIVVKQGNDVSQNLILYFNAISFYL